jgi:hypothetical protein
MLLANIVEDQQRGTITPKRPDKVDAAKAFQELIEYQRKMDFRDEKLPLFVKQALIMGVSPAKVYWDYQTGYQRKTTWLPRMDMGYTPQVDENEDAVICDHPSFEPWPVEDFLWDPSARRFDQCAYVLARTYETMESLREFEKAGVYRNVDEVQSNQRSGTPERTAKSGLMEVETKGRIEVVEYWTRDRLITVANQRVVLRDEKMLFDHGRIPFVMAHVAPDIRRINGLGVIQMIQDLIEALWDSLNQRMDNADHILAAVYEYNPEALDIKTIEAIPGVWIPVDRMETIKAVQQPTNIIAAAIQNDEPLLGAMRDISGVNAYVSWCG